MYGGCAGLPRFTRYSHNVVLFVKFFLNLTSRSALNAYYMERGARCFCRLQLGVWPGEFSSQKRGPRISYPGPRLPPELLSFVVASSPGEGARGAHAAGHSPSPEAKPYTHRHQSCAASGDDARRYPHGDSPSSQKAFQYAIAAAPAAANAAACQRAYCNSSKSVNEPPVSRSCQLIPHLVTRGRREGPPPSPSPPASAIVYSPTSNRPTSQPLLP